MLHFPQILSTSKPRFVAAHTQKSITSQGSILHAVSQKSERCGAVMNPPWEEFPTYERYTIGWRMGAGESYLYAWSDYMKSIPRDFQSRLDYLQTHRPAPLTWSNTVLHTLYPDDVENHSLDPSTRQKLFDLELIQHDAAYQTWLAQQDALLYPWDIFEGESPETTARYCTREFWFVSRRLSAHRQSISTQPIPPAWKALSVPLQTGQVGEVRTDQGLLTLAHMLCAGEILPPWHHGLEVDSCEDSFELDMGFCDAFGLWLMSAFDDQKSLWDALPPKHTIPLRWQSWMENQASLL